jgi:two-component system sensor histidine kinase VicK
VVKYQTEGTGLGLYISKNIIEQTGGKIWFQSIENVGSVFNFSLPVK